MSGQTNSSPAKKNSAFMETVQDKLKDIKNFSNWSAKEQMIAVGAVGVMVGALLPFVAVALPVAATGAIVALTLFFAVKAVEYTFKGLKWSAEKTVDGAKYTAGKVKDASVYTAEKAREGYYSVKGAISSVGQATREGTSSALKTMGDKMSNLGRSMSGLESIPDSIESQGQTVVLKTEERTKNFNSVKEMSIKEVFEDKTVNSSALTKEILSELKRKILDKAYFVDGQQGFKKDQLINQLKQQADFVNKLDAKKLQNLLAKDNNSLYEIFSDHHDEIKRIIKECKIRGSNVEKQLHEPFSSDLGVLDKTATIGQKPSGKQSIPVALPKVPESPTRSGSPDSGISSGPSTPTKEQSPFINLDPFGSIDSRGLSDPLILKKPRTYKSEVHISPQQPGVTAIDLNLQLDFLHYPLLSQHPLLSSQCPLLSSQYPLLSSQCVTLGSSHFTQSHRKRCVLKNVSHFHVYQLSKIPRSQCLGTGMAGEGSTGMTEEGAGMTWEGGTEMTEESAGITEKSHLFSLDE